jgi:signal transduction histidine kinase/ligand-binding sensor domain-containing protein
VLTNKPFSVISINHKVRTRFPFSVIFFTGFLCSHLIGFAQDIHFNLVARSPDDVGHVLSMTQDVQGYLWLATATGLYKYDGFQYTAYNNQTLNPNSPADNYIEWITTDKAGNLWLAPRSTGLDRLDPLTDVFTHFRHKNNDPGSLINDTVSVIMEDHKGIVWVGTFGGLDRLDRKTNTFFHYEHRVNDPLSLSCNKVRVIYEDKQGTIWVGTGDSFFGDNPGNEGGLNKLDKKTGTFTRYMHDEKNPKSLVASRVRAIFEDSRGNFWVGSEGDGLHTMNRVTGEFERHLYDSAHPDKLSRPPLRSIVGGGVDHITFITEDIKKRIWIGTLAGGINVYDPVTQKVTYYGSEQNSGENLADNHFWGAYKSRDNILWISAWENNLYNIDPNKITLPHVRTGSVVFSFAEDDAHTLWMCTMNGLIHMDNKGNEEKYFTDNTPSSMPAPIIFLQKDGARFWAMTWHGLYLFDPIAKTFLGYHRKAGDPNSLISDTILILKKVADNFLWIGTGVGLDQLDIRTGKFSHFKNVPGNSESISNNQVSVIDTDRDQNVWVGTAAGLNRFSRQTGNFKRYLEQSSINWMISDKEGNIWVVTNNGLLKYSKANDQFLPFTDESLLISASYIQWVMEDQEQNLWLSTGRGLIKLNKERKFAVLYGKRQGVIGFDLTGPGYARDNGDLVIGDTSGYFLFQPGLLQQNISAPSVTIRNFLLNDIPIQPSPDGILSAPLTETKQIRLHHDQNTFSFEFSNIDFSSDHGDIRLLYMLQNYDNAWHKSGDEKKAYYFTLPPGNYVFKVKAINAAGVVAEKDMELIIAPPWWSTWWAYSIFILIFTGLVWSFIVYRSRQLMRENRVLEEKVENRTTQLNESFQNLKAAQSQLVHSEKMASLGELTAGIAHEIQNPLNFINNFSEVNTELIDEAEQEINNGNIAEVKTIFNDIRDNERKINHHGKRADSIVKGMLLHSRSSSGVKELTDINSLADEYLRLSYQGLRAKDKSFNASLQTDFDRSISKINLMGQDIGRVLLNLYNNAFYAVTERKLLQVEGYSPIVSASTRRMGDHVEIRVKDNGNGIPQKVIDKIFQPFFTTKPTGQGTGLGLSLSYDIIKAHRGELKVYSKEGEGAEFIILIPFV